MKKACLKIFSAVFAMSMAFGMGQIVSVSATEMPNYVENGVAVNGFYVENGASVHLGAKVAGIRYSTVVTDAFKSYLSATYENATFEWHTLITGVNMLEGGDVTKVTPDLKKPEWVGANAGQAACQDFMPTLNVLEDNEEKGTVADVDKDGKTDEVYYAAITYQDLSDEQKAAASNADLIARSYVKIIQGETETIIYSAAEDTVRNMKAIAYVAIQTGCFTDMEDSLYAYTGVTSADVVANDTVNSFYSLNDKSGQIAIEDINETNCEVYYGARKLSSTLKDGVVMVSGLDDLEAGENLAYELTIFAGGKIYNQAFGCATQVIDEAEDLEIFNMNITDYQGMSEYSNNDAGKQSIMVTYGSKKEGYYVLAGNINASNYAMNTQGYISPTYYNSPDHPTAPFTYADYGFRGTFDGRGYTISGLTLGNKNQELDVKHRTTTGGWNSNTYSLFGIIGKNGVVKNVALTDVKFDLNANITGTTSKINLAICTPIATWVSEDATVENVYVSLKGITRFSDGNTVMSGFAYGVDMGATLKNIVVDDTYVYAADDKLANADNMQKRGSFVYRKMPNQSEKTEKWSNLLVLSTRPLSYYSTNRYDASNVDTTLVKMPNTYRYENVGAWETAQADVSVTAKPTVNDFATKYWHFVNGVPVWGKETA